MIGCQLEENGVAVVTQVVEVTRWATVAVPVEVTREVVIESVVTQSAETPSPVAVGSAETPFILLFSPLYPTNITTTRANQLAQSLQQATQRQFEVVVAANHQEAITLACQNANRTIAFLSDLEFVVAHDQCGLSPRFAGVREGLTWYASMLLTPSTPRILALDQLKGGRWGVATFQELGALYYRALFQEQGVEVAEATPFQTEARTMIALVDGEVDFVTATYRPPILPYNERVWQYGVDSPDLWRETGSMPFRSGIGFIVVNDYVENGGYQLRDARASVVDVRGNIFNETRLLQLSPPLPNGAVAYGAEMTLQSADLLDSALLTMPNCAQSLCSADFFAWQAVAPVTNDAYEAIRFIIEQLQLSADEINTYLEGTK